MRPWKLSTRWKRPAYFNPRTRAGCDMDYTLRYRLIADISIHAPVLGATALYRKFAKEQVLFQSTHPCWVRRRSSSRRIRTAVISIHAPVLGATCPGDLVRRGRCHFNPRTRAGCDRGNLAKAWEGYIISIHAPVLGATSRLSVCSRCTSRNFNPRTRAGCDTTGQT